MVCIRGQLALFFLCIILFIECQRLYQIRNDVYMISEIVNTENKIFKQINGKVLVPKSELVEGVRLILDGGTYATYVRQDGKFSLYGITPGSHILEIVSPHYQYPQIRIDVSSRGKARAMINDHTRRFTRLPLIIEPVGTAEYFEKHQPFNIWSLVTNPLAIMMIIGVFVAFVFPKLIDPEAMKEVQETMQANEEAVRGAFEKIKEKAM